jgi:tryptophanyl-tRNA synthetase
MQKIVYSAMQPSGTPSIGNYLGALKNWLDLQDDYNCIYAIANLHALTIRQNSEVLKTNSKNLLALFLACGLDPDSSTLYYQSDLSEHSELAWFISCYSYIGELNRMTQFKEKSQNHNDNINLGLLSYPVLQCADILLFNTDFVPIGDDQRQHLELTRNIASRFNSYNGEVFKIPDILINKSGSRIMGLQNPENKMSKSDNNDKNIIYILDEPSAILNKLKRSVTDSENIIRYDLVNKPGISNLINIYCSLTKENISDVEHTFSSTSYGIFKKELAERLISAVLPIQNKYKALIKDPGYLEKVAKQGADKAREMAQSTIYKVKCNLGML